MDKPVHQLIYISAANRDFSEEELEEILSTARENNASLGITGMLLFHEGSFIQALEGPQEKVQALYEKISQDKRHTETVVLYKGDQEEPDFESWSMGFYRTNQSSQENLQGFHNFLASGFRNNNKETAGRARNALLQFRKGKWHQNVQVA
ncbi:MAG: BLUF domain-containing protein [Gammaproteobacteria bacterium]|nr:BLUF domain-containing protein [Gammaproteobacteria bacterium]